MADLQPCRLDRACPKCGGKDIHTLWVKAVDFSGDISTEHAQGMLDGMVLRGTRLVTDEHMARACKTCQYKWAERPLDQCSAIDQLSAVGAEAALVGGSDA